MSKASKGNSAVRITINGQVQGVGFRPGVFRAASSCGIAGSVRNTPSGVVIHAEGKPLSVRRFVKTFPSFLPPHAVIRSQKVSNTAARGLASFTIAKSIPDGSAAADIPPDLAVCDACRKELSSPGDRRYRYPFINCTDCGPRFTIVTRLPYDRPFTTMASFTMCGDCSREYRAPSNRRFHAQPDACPVCGPRVTLLDNRQREIAADDAALVTTAALLRSGGIVAIKSLGGYHLACDAGNADAVGRLRKAKDRPEKPFALMAADTDHARKLAFVSRHEEDILTSPAAPVVLLRKRPLRGRAGALLRRAAPGNSSIGIMLPSTPLHHLLFSSSGSKSFPALVMTSGNRRDEPIARTEQEAFDSLSGIAGHFLVHDRPVQNRCDDSIVAPMDKGASPSLIIRRSRGFVPRPVEILPPSSRAPSVLALGAELKNAFCVVRGGKAYLSQYIGDLDNRPAIGFFEEAIERFNSFLGTSPAVIAHDLHPDYASTRYARELAGNNTNVRCVPVQHHEAHIAAVVAEKGISSPVIGFAWDGTGWGRDGTAWGGECFLYSRGRFERLARFDPLPLPGGDIAAREIWRCGLSLLAAAGITDMPPSFRRYPVSGVRHMIEHGINTPLTSSAGRLFDGAAALAGFRDVVTFEAQAAIEMESAAMDFSLRKGYNFDIFSSTSPLTISLAHSIRELWKDRCRGTARGLISARFHRTLADVIVALAQRFEKNTGIRDIVLNGGVFQNRLLLSLSRRLLEDLGFSVHYPHSIPPNDGGIALGQAWIAMNNK